MVGLELSPLPSPLSLPTPGLDVHSTPTSLSVPTNSSQISTEEDLQITLPYICKTCVFILIILMAILSNLLVIASVFLYRKLRGINNYFLVSLAFADLFVACFAMTFNASQQIFGRWMFGPAFCSIYNSIDVHASTVSTLHLCCISLDRYFAIVKPFDYHHYMNTKSALGMIAAAWMCPGLISFVPILLGWSGESGISEDTGNCVFNANVPYALLSSFMTFWCPVIVMVIVYYRVFREAVKQKNSMAMTATVNLPSINGYDTSQHGRREPEITVADLSSSSRAPAVRIHTPRGRRGSEVSGDISRAAETVVEEETRETRTATGKRMSVEATVLDVRMKARNSVFYTGGAHLLEGIKEKKRLSSIWRKSALKEHKAFVTLGVVMGAFLLCWLPFFIWYLTVTMCGDTLCPCPDSVVTLLFWIGYFNSTLNPVIYAMTNRDFKLAFVGILKKIFCFCCSDEDMRNSDF